jgi:HEAT repeat protein
LLRIPVNRMEAIEILRRHQPLPPDSTLSENVLRDFDAARRYFVANPEPEAVPLLLGAIGDGSGFGVYQLIEDAICPLPSSVVLPHLIAALQSMRPAARSWAAEIASNFPDPCLIPFLTPMLLSSDQDCRASAATALRFIPSPEIPILLREAYARTGDPVLQEVLDEI